MKKKNSTDELDFVLRHYTEGAFDPDKALKSMPRPTTGRRPSGGRRWVAAAASVACLVAVASVAVWRLAPPAPTAVQAPAQAAAPAPVQAPEQQAAVVFRFDDTPLPEVLRQLERHYGVSLSATDTTPHLTGSFVGERLDQVLPIIEEVLGVGIECR